MSDHEHDKDHEKDEPGHELSNVPDPSVTDDLYANPGLPEHHDSVNMIRHDDEGIERDVWIVPWQIGPHIGDAFA